MLEKSFTFVGNEPDDLHCFQASLRMAWEGLGRDPLSLEDAERMTGFRAGQQTWSFQGMLSLADAGLSVRSVEDFRPEAFVDDPAAEIRRQAGSDEVAQHVESVTDAAREVDLVRRCLVHPLISFETRVPTVDELSSIAAEPSVAVICNVNYVALDGKPGYNGHFVLISAIRDGAVTIQNPGLPPVEDQVVSVETFNAAWREPSASLANYLAIGETSATR